MSTAKDKFKFKVLKSELAKNIRIVLPMVEEITDQGLMPLCLIGLDVDENGETEIYCATVSNDKSTESATTEIMQLLLSSKDRWTRFPEKEEPQPQDGI